MLSSRLFGRGTPALNHRQIRKSLAWINKHAGADCYDVCYDVLKRVNCFIEAREQWQCVQTMLELHQYNGAVCLLRMSLEDAEDAEVTFYNNGGFLTEIARPCLNLVETQLLGDWMITQHVWLAVKLMRALASFGMSKRSSRDEAVQSFLCELVR